jgi:hypothetical protein
MVDIGEPVLSDKISEERFPFGFKRIFKISLSSVDNCPKPFLELSVAFWNSKLIYTPIKGF